MQSDIRRAITGSAYYLVVAAVISPVTALTMRESAGRPLAQVGVTAGRR